MEITVCDISLVHTTLNVLNQWIGMTMEGQRNSVSGSFPDSRHWATDTSATICPQEEHRVSNLMPCFWILTFTAFIPFWLAVYSQRRLPQSHPRRPESLSDTRASYMLLQHPLDFLLCYSAVSQLCTQVLHKREGKMPDRDLHLFS